MKVQPICYIFGAGEYYYPPEIRVASSDFVIAADGGYMYTKQHKIPVNLVVGDFDSMPFPSQDNIDTMVLPREKDATDMAAALQEGWRRGYRIFRIYGGTGGRIDHTLANIQCIADLAQRGGRGYLFDRDVIITAICNDKVAFSAKSSGTVSVFSYSEVSTGVYENGLKYPLTNATLNNTNPLGISNEFVGVGGSISVQEGTLLVIYPKDTQDIEV